MRTYNYLKKLIFITLFLLFIIENVFAYDESTENPSNFFRVETVVYNPTEVNTENYYSQSPSSKTAKVIKLTELFNYTTNEENKKAIPHISIANYTATLSNENNSSSCRLLIKTHVEGYDDPTNSKDTWFEIDDLKTYIYRREYLEDTATSFTLTLYYLIENPQNILSNVNSSTSVEQLSLDTGGPTDFYLFYLIGGNETSPFFIGNLTDHIVSLATPEFDTSAFSNYLNVNSYRSSLWSETSFFDNLGSNNLEWIIELKVEDGSYDNDNYTMGLSINSLNNYKLVSDSAGMGKKEINYQLRLSKNDANPNNIISVDNDSLIRVNSISSDEIRKFYIYSYSNESTNFLNPGEFKDTIYLNFISDFTPDQASTNSIDVF